MKVACCVLDASDVISPMFL